jgi:hypothetical protein
MKIPYFDDRQSNSRAIGVGAWFWRFEVNFLNKNLEVMVSG